MGHLVEIGGNLGSSASNIALRPSDNGSYSRNCHLNLFL